MCVGEYGARQSVYLSAHTQKCVWPADAKGLRMPEEGLHGCESCDRRLVSGSWQPAQLRADKCNELCKPLYSGTAVRVLLGSPLPSSKCLGFESQLDFQSNSLLTCILKSSRGWLWVPSTQASKPQLSSDAPGFSSGPNHAVGGMWRVNQFLSLSP